MIQKFEDLTSSIAIAYKYIVMIRSYEMNNFGLKSSHVRCLYHLNLNPEGLTAVDLCDACHEIKTEIAKTIGYLQRVGYITPDKKSGKRKNRVRFLMTPKGAEIFGSVIDYITKIVTESEKDISPEDIEIFYRTYKKINNNIKNICEELNNI